MRSMKKVIMPDLHGLFSKRKTGGVSAKPNKNEFLFGFMRDLYYLCQKKSGEFDKM